MSWPDAGRQVQEEAKEQIDQARLLALFDLAGPAQAEELALRLEDDLTSASQALIRAGEAGDAVALRAQSHVLMAISGTVHAAPLEALARQVNALAHGGTRPSPELLGEIRCRTGHLVAQVRAARSLWMARP